MSHTSAALSPEIRLSITKRSRRLFSRGKVSAVIRLFIGALMLYGFYSTSCSRAFVRAAPSVYGQFSRNVASVHGGRHVRNHPRAAVGQQLDYAFAFDIDGVLMLGKNPIPAAQRALKILHHRKIPYILLTNGGGKLERERTAELSDKLRVPIDVSQLIQSHTPYKHFSHQFQNVVIFSKDDTKCRQVAEHYGFKNVWTPTDINANFPDLWPFRSDHPQEFKKIHPSTPIDAVLVFNDPADWGRDSQIIVDLVLSPDRTFGNVLRLEKQNRNGTGVHVIFSANDLIWTNPYHSPRWGQGAFRRTVETLYKDLTHDPIPLQITQFGKPSTATFTYAENVLMDYLRDWYGTTGNESHSGFSNLELQERENSTMTLNITEMASPRRVYMFGDSPDSDIRGANEFGWYSILVRTGNFKGKGNSEKYPAKRVFDDVEKAVDWIIRYEDTRFENLLARNATKSDQDGYIEI